MANPLSFPDSPTSASARAPQPSTRSEQRPVIWQINKIISPTWTKKTISRIFSSSFSRKVCDRPGGRPLRPWDGSHRGRELWGRLQRWRISNGLSHTHKRLIYFFNTLKRHLPRDIHRRREDAQGWRRGGAGIVQQTVGEFYTANFIGNLLNSIQSAAKARKEFHAETEILQQLHHPNLVQVSACMPWWKKNYLWGKKLFFLKKDWRQLLRVG